MKLAFTTALMIFATPVWAGSLFSPQMHVAAPANTPAVALTLDACEGKADERLFHALEINRIKATIFVTARWLKRNSAAISEIKAHSDLFEIENHGARHLAAVDHPGRVFGIATAGSEAGLKNEIEGGAAAIRSLTGNSPRWYRGATAEYTSSSEKYISSLHVNVAGFSVLGDGGARFTAAHAESAVAAARSGDVILAHINHPERPAALGVIRGILDLKARNYTFVRLDGA